MPSITDGDAAPEPANDGTVDPFYQYERARRGDLRCPHCDAQASCRTSKGVTSTYRDIFYFCTNFACGHTFKAHLAYDYGLSPSAIPNPAVKLPMRPMQREDVIKPDPPPDDPRQPRLF